MAAAATTSHSSTLQTVTLDEIREAIIGSTRPPVRAMLIRGVLRHGFNTVTAQPLDDPLPLEIRFDLPDRYVVIVESHGMRRKLGFSGRRIIWGMEAVGRGSSGGGSPPKDPEFLHQEFARLVLALLAETQTIETLRIVEPRSPDRLRLAGAGSFRVDLEIDPKTKLPTRLLYPGKVGLPQRALTPAEIRANVTLPYRILDTQLEMLLADSRVVDGITIPHRLTVRAAGVRVQDFEFREVVVNPAFGPEAFR